MLVLGAWALVSVAFVLGWAMRSATVAERHPSKVRRAPLRVRRLGFVGLFTTLAGKLMLSGVAVAAVGTLAVDGSLPEPVQDAVSAAGQSIGLEIPSSEDKRELRFASPRASENPDAVRQQLSVVFEEWEGESDCEYAREIAQAAGTSPPEQCLRGDREEDRAGGRGSASSNLVTSQPPTTEESTPPTAEPPASEPPASEPPPSVPPPSEPPIPVEPPPVEPPPAEPPPAEPPPANPSPGDPPAPAPGPPPLAETPPDDPRPPDPPPLAETPPADAPQDDSGATAPPP